MLYLNRKFTTEYQIYKCKLKLRRTVMGAATEKAEINNPTPGFKPELRQNPGYAKINPD